MDILCPPGFPGLIRVSDRGIFPAFQGQFQARTGSLPGIDQGFRLDRPRPGREEREGEGRLGEVRVGHLANGPVHATNPTIPPAMTPDWAVFDWTL